MVTTAKRTARKSQQIKRTVLIAEQERLTNQFCKGCPKHRLHKDPAKKCGGCSTYKQLRAIGRDLDNMRVVTRWVR